MPPTFVTLLLAALLGPDLLRPEITLLGDSLHIYQVFYDVFTQLALTGSIPRWTPYGAFGTTADLRQFNLPLGSVPLMQVLVMLGFRNAWKAFLLALLLNGWLSATGTYLFAREFAGRTVATLASATVALPIVLIVNLHFSLYALVTPPFVLLFLFRWARQDRPDWFFAAVAAAGAGAFMPSPYSLIYHAYAFAFVAIILALVYRPRLVVRPDRRLVFAGAVAVTILALAAYSLWTSIAGLTFTVPQRDAGLQGSLVQFLNYGGGLVGPAKLLEPFLGVSLRTPDILVFLTSSGLVAAVLALRYGTGRTLLALGVPLVVLIAFCGGPYSPATRAAYHLPLMGFFRHVGYAWGLPKLLLAAIGAHGLQRFLDRIGPGRIGIDRQRLGAALIAFAVGLVGLAVGAWFLFAYLGSFKPSYIEPELGPAGTALLSYGLLGPFVVGLVLLGVPRRAVVPFLIAIAVVQGGLFQWYATYGSFSLPMTVPLSAKIVAPAPFAATRVLDIPSQPEGPLYGEVAMRISSYAEAFSFLQFDPCATSRSRTDYLATSVAELMQRQFGTDQAIRLPDLLRTDPGNAFFPVAGCGVAKVQWLAAAADAGEPLSPGAAWPEDCVSGRLCLENPPTARRLALPWPNGDPPRHATLAEQGITVASFSFDRIRFQVDAKTDGWLVYADAWDPRWTVRVDGHSDAAWRANIGFRAAHLTRGRHLVDWRFAPRDPREWLFLLWLWLCAGMTAAAVWLAAAGAPAPRALDPTHAHGW